MIYSLHASTDIEQDVTDEESLDREQLLEEMRRHSRMATATQPINKAYPKSPVATETSDDFTQPHNERYVIRLFKVVISLL